MTVNKKQELPDIFDRKSQGAQMSALEDTLNEICRELRMIRQAQDRQLNGLLKIYDRQESKLSHLESIDDSILKSLPYLTEIKNSSFNTQMALLRIEERMKQRKRSEHGRLPEVSQNE